MRLKQQKRRKGKVKKGDDASNRVGWVGSGLAKVLPLGLVVTNSGWWRYTDTEILQY